MTRRSARDGSPAGDGGAFPRAWATAAVETALAALAAFAAASAAAAKRRALS